MGKFSDRHQGVNKARQTGGGVYWEPGSYRVRIEAVKYIEEGYKGESFIIEAKVLEVLRHVDVEKRLSKGKELTFNASRKAGEIVGQVIKMDQQSAEGNINNFIRASFATIQAQKGNPQKMDSIEFEDADVDWVVGEEQPCAGLELHLECYGVVTQKNNGPFTVCKYGVLDEFSAEEAA
jgi:hypothetical protein